jgi:transposase InsO family protein
MRSRTRFTFGAALEPPARSPLTYKTEVIHRSGLWRTLEAVEFAILEWVDWFNHRRPLEPIGTIPPAEAEARFHAQSEELAMVA